jgi:hypothetical protein
MAGLVSLFYLFTKVIKAKFEAFASEIRDLREVPALVHKHALRKTPKCEAERAPCGKRLLAALWRLRRVLPRWS